MADITLGRIQEIKNIFDSENVPVGERGVYWWDAEREEYIVFNSRGSKCQQLEG